MKSRGIVACSLTMSFAIAALMFSPFEADAGNAILPIPSATPVRKSPAKRTASRVSSTKRTRKSDFFGNSDPSHSYGKPKSARRLSDQASQTSTGLSGKPTSVVRKGQDIEVENDETHTVGHDRRPKTARKARTETVDNNETITVNRKARTETVDNNETITVHGQRTETVNNNETRIRRRKKP